MANANDFKWNELKHDGKKITSTKSDITNRYGNGKFKRPNYECGFHSGESYYQIIYTEFTYIGSDDEGVILEQFKLNKAKKSQLTYKGIVLNRKINKEEFARIFGNQAEEYFLKYPDSNTILLHEKSDDAALFEFDNNFLISFSYWSPC